MPPPMPPPKFATARDLRFPTRGTLQGAFAEVWLGRPLMPWQQLVADVSGEYDPATGLPRHTLIVCTVQRQAGKSHLAMAQNGERCFSRPKFRSWYTAQTGGDARDQFLKFQDDVVDGTPLNAVVRTLRGNGHEVMHFPNGSTIRPHPPTEGALHGKQSDRNDVDEAWWFSLEHGRALMQASSPTKLTRPGAQTFIWSAGGTAASTWLAALVARGRAGDPGVCYFEWGVPDDLPVPQVDDVDLMRQWAEFHPAYGISVTADSLVALRKDTDDDAAFARAAGNRWTEVIGGAISAEAWESVRFPDVIPDDARVEYGAARAADGTHVVIAAAAKVGDVTVVEVIDVMPAYGAGARCKTWAGSSTVAVSSSGPSAVLLDDLTTTGANVLPMTGSNDAAACAKVVDALPGREIRYRPHPALDAAVGAAGRRSVGDGGKVWARTASAAPIAALEAATAAVWSLDHARNLAHPVQVVFR